MRTFIHRQVRAGLKFDDTTPEGALLSALVWDCNTLEDAVEMYVKRDQRDAAINERARKMFVEQPWAEYGKTYLEIALDRIEYLTKECDLMRAALAREMATKENE